MRGKVAGWQRGVEEKVIATWIPSAGSVFRWKRWVEVGGGGTGQLTRHGGGVGLKNRKE